MSCKPRTGLLSGAGARSHGRRQWLDHDLNRQSWKIRYERPMSTLSHCHKAIDYVREHWLTITSQPRPLAAIELIHKQPVRWTKERVVSCDGGGGPLGHPRIFINVDKPQICMCTYCGLPFVSLRWKQACAMHMLIVNNRPMSTTASTFRACLQPRILLSLLVTLRRFQQPI